MRRAGLADNQGGARDVYVVSGRRAVTRITITSVRVNAGAGSCGRGIGTLEGAGSCGVLRVDGQGRLCVRSRGL